VGWRWWLLHENIVLDGLAKCDGFTGWTPTKGMAERKVTHLASKYRKEELATIEFIPTS